MSRESEHNLEPDGRLWDNSGPMPGIINTRCTYCKQSYSVIKWASSNEYECDQSPQGQKRLAKKVKTDEP